MNMNEHQETIDKLRGIVSEKTDDISNIQMNLENTNTTLKAQIQELQEKEHQLLRVKNDLRENMYQTEQLKKQLETQNSVLESTEIENLRLTLKLHENVGEGRVSKTQGQIFLSQPPTTLTVKGKLDLP